MKSVFGNYEILRIFGIILISAIGNSSANLIKISLKYPCELGEIMNQYHPFFVPGNNKNETFSRFVIKNSLRF